VQGCILAERFLLFLRNVLQVCSFIAPCTLVGIVLSYNFSINGCWIGPVLVSSLMKSVHLCRGP
jgi:hypothetical protein